MPSDDTRPPFPQPSMFIGMNDVHAALAAGFSKDEVVYMFDLREDDPVLLEAIAVTAARVNLEKSK